MKNLFVKVMVTAMLLTGAMAMTGCSNAEHHGPSSINRSVETVPTQMGEAK